MTAAKHTGQSRADAPDRTRVAPTIVRAGAVTAAHVALGAAAVLVNLAAGLYGAWAWWRDRPAPAFWPLLRAGQLVIALQAALGGVLLLMGETLPPLHLVYGLVPLGVAFVAEQLRLVAAQTELDRRGLAGREAVGALSEGERRALVRAILRRELGVMAASALVVALLAVRAAGLP
jgi:hypothetical protein